MSFDRNPTDTQRELIAVDKSKIRKYQDLVIGQSGVFSLLRYEIISLLSTWVPGALGLFLRSKFYRCLLGSTGRNVVFGKDVILRHPHKIHLGDNVIIDDNCVLDAKGIDNKGIFIENNVFVGRNTIIYCQNGDIYVGENANISSNCQIFSAKSVRVGKGALVGAYSYLIGGGHNYEDVDTLIIEQGRIAKGITLEDNIWIGAGVKILDGLIIGESAIIGTGAVVTDNVPEFAIMGGVPAKFIRDRRTKISKKG